MDISCGLLGLADGFEKNVVFIFEIKTNLCFINLKKTLYLISEGFFALKTLGFLFGNVLLSVLFACNLRVI